MRNFNNFIIFVILNSVQNEYIYRCDIMTSLSHQLYNSVGFVANSMEKVLFDLKPRDLKNFR